MSNLSDHYTTLICKTLEQFIEAQSKSEKRKILIESASKGNMMGIVNRIFIDDQENNNDLQTIIVKTSPQCTLGREFFNIRKHFLREAVFYDEVNSIIFLINKFSATDLFRV